MVIEEKINFDETLQMLKKETIESQKFLEALQILDKITINIVNDPKNEQFRTLKLTNEKLKEKLFRYTAGLELLFKVLIFHSNSIRRPNSKSKTRFYI